MPIFIVAKQRSTQKMANGRNRFPGISSKRSGSGLRKGAALLCFPHVEIDGYM